MRGPEGTKRPSRELSAVDHAGFARGWQRLAENESHRARAARDGDPVCKGDEHKLWADRAAFSYARARYHVERLGLALLAEREGGR